MSINSTGLKKFLAYLLVFTSMLTNLLGMGVVQTKAEDQSLNQIYISLAGNDETGDGTAVKPYATIEKGFEMLQDGQTLVIKAGEYSFTNNSLAFPRLNGKNFSNGVTIMGEEGTVVKSVVTTKAPAGSPNNATFDIVNSSNIKIYGITFTGSYTASGTWDYIRVASSNNITVSNCTFIGNATVCGMLIISSAGVNVNGNLFSNIRDHSINLQNTNNGKFYNNIFNGFSRGISIYFACSNNEIINNTFNGNADGDIVYFKATLPANNVYKNNIFQKGIAEINSTTANKNISAYIEGNVFENNLFNIPDGDTIVAKSADGSTLTYNEAIAKGYFVNSVAANPLYLGSADFRIPANSPCANAGIVIDYITTDYAGNARTGNNDIGAYEADPNIITLDTYYVSPYGNDGNTGEESAPFATIQKGLNSLGQGKTLVIKAGTYNEKISVSGLNNVKIIGEQGAKIQYTAQGLTSEDYMMLISASSTVEIKGLEFYAARTNCGSTDFFILGIKGSNDIQINNCKMISNVSGAGGIKSMSSTNVQIFSNVLSSLRGHSCLLDKSTGCRIYNNVIAGFERGISLYNASDSNEIVNNTFSKNVVSDIVYYNALQKNNIIKNNIFGKAISELTSKNDINEFIKANIITHNLFNVADADTVIAESKNGTTLTYNEAIAKGYFANSMVSDPLFAEGGYVLKTESPCIDAGDMTVGLKTDILGKPRDIPDIGAYEDQTSYSSFTVESALPQGNNVKSNESIQIDFTSEIDKNSIAGKLVIEEADAVVPAEITVSGKTIILSNYTLRNSTEYTVTVFTGIKDLSGKALKRDYSWKFTTQAAPVLDYNCLQVGGPGSTKAFGSKAISPVSGDFYVQFDYMYPEGQTMSGFYLFSSYDGTAYKDPEIIHSGDNFTFKCKDANYSLADNIKPGKWYNMTLHFTEDGYLEMFIDGVKQLFNNGSTKIKITKDQAFANLGYIGDLSSKDYGGTAYYDNFKIVKDSKVTFEENFDNGEAVNWTVMSTNTPGIFGLSTDKHNCEIPELIGITASGENGRTGFVIGDSGRIIVSGKLSNYKNAVLGLAKVNISDPKNLVGLTNNNDGTYNLLANAKGETTLDVDVILDGKVAKTTLPIIVTETPEIYGIAFDQSEVDIIVGGNKEIGVEILSTDGTKTASDLSFDKVTLTSDSADIATAVQKSNKVHINSIAPGRTNVNIAITSGTKEFTASIAVNVLTIDDIKSRVRHSTIFLGDKERILVTAAAVTGEVINNKLLTIENSSSNQDVAIIDENGYIVAKSVGTATITTTVYLGGKTLQNTFDIEVKELTTSKTHSSYYTEEKRANAGENFEKYDWAKNIKSGSVQLADSYLALGYDFLWNSITSQMIPRSYAVASKESWGCLNCGESILKFGQYPYGADPINNPWKLTCPSCKMQFPTNNFEGYYKGGLDSDGFFDPVLAKQHNDELIANGEKGNLVNILYPEKSESWGVDDGTGFIDEHGRRFTFIAYYNHWKLWYGGFITTALNSFRDAYLYTGDVKYADAGIVILDRIADVYPEMNLEIWRFENGYLNSNGNCNKGKVIGSIWETGLAENFILAYDAFYPALADNSINLISGEVLEYLNTKSLSVDKSNVKRIRRNIEDGILRQIYPAVKNAEIRGNSGMHQSTLALAAVVMDSNPDTKEWLEFNFKSGTTNAYQVTGGNIYSVFVNDIDRDGHGDEGSPGYNSGWLSQYLNVAKALDGYSIEGMESVDLFKNVKFQKMFHSMYPLIVSDIFTPTIGDTAKTGNPYIAENLSNMVTAYQKFRDPVFAQVAYLLNNNSTQNIKLGIFDKNPEDIALDIQNVIDTEGVLDLGGTNATGFGFAALRDGKPGEKLVIEGTEIDFNSMTILENSKPTKYFDSNGTLQFEADAVGDSITFEFNIAEDMRKTMYIDMWTASSYGIYEVYINGQKVSEISFQGAGPAVRKVGNVELKKGANTIRFVLTDKPGGKKAGFRQMILSDTLDKPLEETTQRDIWMYYGRTYNKASHGHKDALNLGLHAFNIDLMPDLGYPRYANEEDKHRRSLVSNTISHNTVVVNGRAQDAQIVGQPLHFDQGDLVKMVDVDSKTAYSETSMYRRTSAMIKVDDKNSYIIDLFRIKGGDSHMYSFHGADDNGITTEGLNLVKQADASGNYVGTYAGRDIAYSKDVADTTGFKYFFNVDKQAGNIGNFSVDYNVLDTWNTKGEGNGMPTDVHLKLTMLGQFDEVTLSEAEPPENKVGNPAALKYVFAKRTGSNLDSCFTSVIEPYSGESFIDKSEALTVKEGDVILSDIDVRAIKVTLKNGRVDYIVNALDNTKTYTVIDGDTVFNFKGFMGVYSKLGDQKIYYMNDGETIADKKFKNIKTITGSVVRFTQELSTNNEIVIKANETDVDVEKLAGRYVYIENDGTRNAAYKIIYAVKTDENIILNIGNLSPIRAYKNNDDFSQGFVYDIGVGKQISIPLSIKDGTNVAKNKTALYNRIAEAQAKYNAAVVGSNPGEYPQAAKNEFKEAIDNASAVMQNMFANTDEVVNAIKKLNSAIKLFNSKVIPDVLLPDNVVKY